jgi:hypothetical protein
MSKLDISDFYGRMFAGGLGMFAGGLNPRSSDSRSTGSEDFLWLVRMAACPGRRPADGFSNPFR